MIFKQDKIWKVVEGFFINDFLREKMDFIVKELVEEKEIVFEFFFFV